MTLRKRVAQLEGQRPPEDEDGIAVIWWTAVGRKNETDPWTSRPHAAWVLPGKFGPGETLTYDNERIPRFEAKVLNAIRRHQACLSLIHI